MIRYALTATALKAFSASRPARRLYRNIANIFGGGARKNIDIDSHVKRGRLLLSLCDKHQVNQDGGRSLEIGTGWLHWYSIYLRLFYDVNITMMDIWDNRQLPALKSAFRKLGEQHDSKMTAAQLRELDFIAHVNSFAELYDRLHLEYVIDENGSLDRFPSNSFDCVFSFHVLEHVQRDYANQLAGHIQRMLKPGGFSIHQIGIDDHLAHYDRSVSPMNYLQYSDATWEKYFQNEVQYFNRILMSDWLDIFERQGFALREKIPVLVDIGPLRVHPKYQHYAKEDLSCTNLTIVYQKPK